MKNIISFALVITYLTCFAQENSTYPNIPITEFMSVDIIDDYVIARGTCDQIWSSTNAGTTWTYDEMLNLEFANVSLITSDPTKAVILADQKIVLYDLLTQQTINSFEDASYGIGFGNITMTQGEDIYLLTSQGLYTATQSEFEWERVFEKTFETDRLKAADITDDYIFIGTQNGKIYRYSINDKSSTLISNNTQQIREISMGTNDIGYAIIDGSPKVQKTIDGCATFTTVDALAINRNVHAYGENIVATILGLRMDVSLDGGQTVELYSMSNTATFGDIDNGFIANDGTIYAYGKGSTIAKTVDNGESFQFLNPYNRSDLRDINIYDDGYGLACGEHSTIVQTLDNGQTWSPVEMGITADEFLFSIDRLANGNILVSGQEGIHVIDNNEIIHTEEVQCSDLLSANAGNQVAFINNQGIYQIIRSVDDGMSWTVTQNELPFASHITQGVSGKIYLATNTTDVYVSDDEGATWTVQDYGIEFNVMYPYDDQVIMGVAGRYLHRSEDGGDTWSIIYDAYLIDNVTYLSSTTFYVTVGQDGNTYLMYTDDSGENWELKFTNCTQTLAMAKNSADEIIMAQATGHINLYSEVNPTSIQKLSYDVQLGLHIWPNPLEKNLPLNIDNAWSNVKIIDIEGRVLIKFSGRKNTLDLSQLESGLYIIQAQHNGLKKNEKILIL